MEDLLSRAGNQAVTFAIRSGIAVVSSYAIKNVTKFLDKLPADEKSNLERLRKMLKINIKIITPSIDLIQLLAAKGYTTLQNTVSLTRELRRDINKFDENVEKANLKMQTAKSSSDKQKTYKEVEKYMTDLLNRLESSIQLLQLAITTSGANLSATLPDTVSPCRLLQASTLLLTADSIFVRNPSERQQVYPTFTMKLYTVFYGTARDPHFTMAGDITWKEEYPKCFVEIFRVPAKHDASVAGLHGDQDKYSYELVITEDLDDGRFHDELELPEYKNATGPLRGRSRTIPLTIVTRLFFSASGKLLDIEDAVSPVLVVKLNKAFLSKSPYYFFDEDSDSDSDAEGGDAETAEDLSLAARVDSPTNIEWLAFELWQEDDESDGEVSDDGSADEWVDDDNDGDQKKKIPSQRNGVLSESSLISAFQRLSLSSADIETLMTRRPKGKAPENTSSSLSSDNQMSMLQLSPTMNSLSLLEYLIRLTALQTNDQASVLTIADERISLYLRDENRQTSRTASRETNSRDISDPIGDSVSPSLGATRFADLVNSGGSRSPGSRLRARHSRTSTTPVLPITGGVNSGNNTVTADPSSGNRRRSDRIQDQALSSRGSEGRHSGRRPSPGKSRKGAALPSPLASGSRGVQDMSRGSFVPLHLQPSGGQAAPRTPRTVVAPGRLRRQGGTPDTGEVGHNSMSLTPWELDRLRGFESQEASPLDGKVTRRVQRSRRMS
ncbi:RanGTP-binding protein-domain-containing protein [Limtongia smithiae]|uniref:RanGTP-binding protein-domain-containing protein n=1 Tax=Limtongia smithiae TaxID=1125753 RepID=UPI0034CD9833